MIKNLKTFLIFILKRFVFMLTSLMWTNTKNNLDLDVLSVRSRASTSWFSLGFWMVLFCSVGSQIVSLSQQQWNNNQHDSVSELCKLRCIPHFTPPSPSPRLTLCSVISLRLVLVRGPRHRPGFWNQKSQRASRGWTSSIPPLETDPLPN